MVPLFVLRVTPSSMGNPMHVILLMTLRLKLHSFNVWLVLLSVSLSSLLYRHHVICSHVCTSCLKSMLPQTSSANLALVTTITESTDLEAEIVHSIYRLSVVFFYVHLLFCCYLISHFHIIGLAEIRVSHNCAAITRTCVPAV